MVKNLKEIALKVAKEMRDKSEYDALDLVCNAEPFAVALLTEIAKENEPVAFVQATPDGNLMLAEITKTAEAQPLDQWD